MSILKIDGVSYSYNGTAKKILDNLSFDFEKGKTYAIVGRSGSGKTTLLSLMSGLDTVQSGKILYNDTDIKTIDKYKYRSQNIGVIFQSFNLLPQLTAIENVILSMDVAGLKFENKRNHALELLDKVDIDEETANRRILNLSGGEQQRVAIARTLSYNPDVILADEPTGNLDGETEAQVIGILKDLAAQEDKCVIIVTHSPTVSQSVDVVYKLISTKPVKTRAQKNA